MKTFNISSLSEFDWEDDLESILNKITSELTLVELSMSPITIGSLIFPSSLKKSIGFLPLTSKLLSKIYDKIFKKWDLPLPKNPEIHTPISSVGVWIPLL